jgi:hypothetical protein
MFNSGFKQTCESHIEMGRFHETEDLYIRIYHQKEKAEVKVY